MRCRTGYRSSHRGCSIRKGVLRKFAKFTEKHLCQSLFFNKVAGLRSATSLNMRHLHRCFCEIFKNTFLAEHLWAATSRDNKRDGKIFVPTLHGDFFN